MGVNGLAALVLGKLFDRYGISVLSLGILVSVLRCPWGFWRTRRCDCQCRLLGVDWGLKTLRCARASPRWCR